MNQTNQNLLISEHFYSLQGEGSTVGIPSIFLRLGKCNLSCGGQTTIQTKEIEKNATWRCDTIEIWTKYKSFSHSALHKLFEEHNYYNYLNKGAHIIITGGEPLIQQEALISWLEVLNNYWQVSMKNKGLIPIEVETNGTILSLEKLDRFVTQYNVSPKPSNSGMKKDSRINSSAIQWFANKKNTLFKFVIRSKEDVNEANNELILPYNIKSSKVWLMPAADSQNQLKEANKIVVDSCLEEGYKFSQRLHIHLWDKKTGV